MIVWLNGARGAGKSTTAVSLQHRLPDSRVLDAEKVGETLMDVRPGLPELGNFQHWPPWRPLVVETARRVLEYAGGTLIMPMTVLVQRYWDEIRSGLDAHRVPIRHLVLHADAATLRRRIDEDRLLGPSAFRHGYVDAYADAFDAWLRDEATVIDTVGLTREEVADRAAEAVGRGRTPGSE